MFAIVPIMLPIMASLLAPSARTTKLAAADQMTNGVNRVAAGKLKCACVRAEQVQDGRGEAQQYGGKHCADDQARP